MISTDVLSRSIDSGSFVISEVHDELLSLADVQCKVVVFSSLCQLGYLISLLCLVVIVYQANNCGVVCKPDDPVVAVYGCTVT